MELGDLLVSASQHWGLQAPATTSNFLYESSKSEPALQSNKSANGKKKCKWEAGACLKFLRNRKGSVLQEEIVQEQEKAADGVG